MSSMGAVARSPRLGRSPEDPDDRLRRVSHPSTVPASVTHHLDPRRDHISIARTPSPSPALAHGIGCGTGKARRSDARSMPVCRGTNQIPLAAIAEAEAKRQPDKKGG